MIRLRITPDGRIRGLWTDLVNFTALGHTTVRREVVQLVRAIEDILVGAGTGDEVCVPAGEWMLR